MIFAFSQNRKGAQEESAVVLYAGQHGIPCRPFQRPSDVLAAPDAIPVGTIDWVQGCGGFRAIPDYYPDFLSTHLGRKVWKADAWPLGQRVFVKPADAYKRFNGRVSSGGWRGKKKGPYWCSELVRFVDEWRYYVADGELLYRGWYQGRDDEDKPAPPLDVNWPTDYCGAVDFGTTEDGRLLLVEAQEPFSCGWYGRLNDYEIYGKWIVAGWSYLKRKYRGAR